MAAVAVSRCARIVSDPSAESSSTSRFVPTANAGPGASGSRICRGNQPGDHVCAPREDQHSSDDLVDLVQPQTESGHDTEVAAAAPEGPEEIGVRVLVHIEMLAVGGHHFSREHVVDGEAVLADEEADAAAERDPTEADARGVAEPGREAAFRQSPW